MIMATLKKVCYTVQVKAPNKQELVQVFYCIYFSVYLFCLFKHLLPVSLLLSKKDKFLDGDLVLFISLLSPDQTVKKLGALSPHLA